jgi:26S proteasome regulatory subunit N5
MSEGVLKPEKDFSKEVDKQLPEAEKLAQVGGTRRRCTINDETRRRLTFCLGRPTSKGPLRSSQP